MKKFYPPVHVAILWLAGLALSVCMMGGQFGCNGDATSTFSGRERTELPNGVVFERESDSYAASHAPPAASQPVDVSTNAFGGTASGSGTYAPIAKTLNDYIGGNFRVLYVIGGGMVAAAFVLPFVPFVRIGKTEAVMLAAGGACLLFAPTFLAVAGPMLAIVAGVLLIFALLVFVGRKLGFGHGVKTEVDATTKQAAEALAAGDAATAATMLTTTPAMRAAIGKVSK